MTDDERHADMIAMLTEIRDQLIELVVLTRERPPAIAPPNPLGSFGDIFQQALADARQKMTASGRDVWTAATWDGEITPPDGDDGKAWLVAAGARWRWIPTIQSVDGPWCANRHRLRYQDSAAGSHKAVVDTQRLGPIGWLTCPSCGTTYAVAGAVIIGAIRAAVDVAFRGRLGLGAKE